jgi:hypothetical protein
MKKRLVLAAIVVVLGCNNKEGERPDANTSSGATTAAPVRLANLESAPYLQEVWTDNEGGAQMQLIYYQADNVRVSAQCRSATGQLACDALKFIRSEKPVSMKKAQLDGRTSAGVKV